MIENGILLAGLGLSLFGALVVAVTDAWLSRMMLIYLDAVEANVSKLIATVRAGGTDLAATGIDLKRDRRQNQVRAYKTLGWLALTVGFGLQLVAVLVKSPA